MISSLVQPVHNNIVCDSCYAFPIKGRRFKCGQCEDFDLCASCKASGAHSEHARYLTEVLAPLMQSVQDVVHEDIGCDGCLEMPIKGVRFKCLHCPDFDLCFSCKSKDFHNHHRFASIPVPSQSKQHNGNSSEDQVHFFSTCDFCGMQPICGLRHKCLKCNNIDLCSSCMQKGCHSEHAAFVIPLALLPSRVTSFHLPHGPSLHIGVHCDACGMTPIQGTRYKCEQCPDFDLCSRCKSLGCHSEHTVSAYPKKNQRSAGEQGGIPPQATVSKDASGMTPVGGTGHNKREQCPDFDLCCTCKTLGCHSEHTVSALQSENKVSSTPAQNVPEEFASLRQELENIKEEITCPICLDQRKEIIFQCGHGTCVSCGTSIQDCPICRQGITTRIKMY